MISSIQTISGDEFNFISRTEFKHSISDIAHALSNICRFNGHCTSFYSVAEHSYHVMTEVLHRNSCLSSDKRMVWSLAFYALLHDAAEAYIGDIPTPIKKGMSFSGTSIERIEYEILKEIHRSLAPKGIYEITGKIEGLIRVADYTVLAAEKEQIMAKSFEWDLPYKPSKTKIKLWGPKEASLVFVSNFMQVLNRIERLDK